MLAPLIEIVAAICVVTAFLDLGVNGARGAEWAPIGLVIAGLCAILALVIGA